MSVSTTQTFQVNNSGHKGFREQRAYDHLYDPTFTVSAEVDHARANYRAQGSMELLKKVPQFNTMFSHLPHHPRFALSLSTHDPVPAFISRRWRGLTEHRGGALSTVTGVLPGVQLHKPKSEDVTGVDRWKYFKRPLIPFSQRIPAHVVFALPRDDPQDAQRGSTEWTGRSFQRTVGVQTDYRDSEAQTDPYTPEYMLHPGTAPPELLTLATFTWGRGLPAGLEEVQMMERARKKRAWEAALPPLGDLAQLERRRRMMDAMERSEWAFREQEIEKLQEARLTLLTQLLRQRESEQDEATVKRLDEHFSQLQKQKEKRLQKIQKNYVLGLRKMMTRRMAVEGRPERRDIIADHLNYSSETYAPLSRRGTLCDRHKTNNTAKSHYLNTYEGLLELEVGLPASVLEPTIKPPESRGSKGFTRRSERLETMLMRTHQALKEKHVHVEEGKPLRFLYKVERAAPRPPTPVVDAPHEEDEEKELAVLVLQKLLRGRTVQNQMLEGLEVRLELIQELRTTHTLQREEQELLRAEKQVTLALQRQRETHEHKMSQVEGCVAGLSGSVMADTLDLLAKELLRLQDERRVHAFTLLAERGRRLREAEESGRRQQEERRRREEDEIFKQVMKVHQATVDLYLEDVILNTVEHVADAQARGQVRQMAEELDHIAHAMEHRRNSVQSEEIVADLVYSFLIPEVQKISVREKVRQSQRKHLSAARTLIHGVDDSRPLSPSSRASASELARVLELVEDAVGLAQPSSE